MSNESPGTTDPPIIVQGGGSIRMNVPPKFNENGSGPEGRRYRNPDQDIISLTVDGKDIPVGPRSLIKITYGSGGTGGGAGGTSGGKF